MCILGQLSIKVVVKEIKGILEIKLHKLSVKQAAQSVTSSVKLIELMNKHWTQHWRNE